jgi:Spy/CpxP family protein refolding chaperone
MRSHVIAAAMTATLALSAGAQGRDTVPRGPQQRAEMEQQFRARLAAVVRERLGLTDDQARQLQEVDRRYEPERRSLMRREMQARRALRQQVEAGSGADQNATAALLDQLLAAQRERAELATREQRELSTFLTPVQRAKLLALQADLQRRVMNAHRGGQEGGGREGGHRRERRAPPQ